MRCAPRLFAAMVLLGLGHAFAASIGSLDWGTPTLWINPAMAVGQEHHDTTLRAAARDGNLEAVTRLLRQPGAQVDARDSGGRTALMSINCDPNAPGFPKNSIAIAQALLSHGANVNAHDSDGMTALMWAATQHNDDLVHYLVQHGADAAARDKAGNTALIQVMRSDDETSDLIKYLCPSKAVANMRNAQGQTALMVFAGAARYSENSGGAVNLLASLGADVNAQDANGNTALMDAAANSAVQGSADVAQALISDGARVGAKNKRGETAFDRIPPGGDSVAGVLMAAGIKVPDLDGVWEGTVGSRSVMLCMWMNRFHKDREAAYYALEAKKLILLSPSSDHSVPNDDLLLQGEGGTWEFPVRYHDDEISGVFSSPESRQPIQLTRIHDFRIADDGNPCASRTFLNGLTQSIERTQVSLDGRTYFTLSEQGVSNVQGFQVVGDGDVIEQINRQQLARFKKHIEESDKCRAGVIDSYGMHAWFGAAAGSNLYMRSEVPVWMSADWLVARVAASESPVCEQGTNDAQAPEDAYEVIDLRTGAAEDAWAWFSALGASADMQPDGSVNRPSPSLLKILGAAWSKVATGDCAGYLGDGTAVWWSMSPDASGIWFHARFAPPFNACNNAVHIEYRDLTPFLNAHGRAVARSFFGGR